jgi:xylulokinase
MADAGYLLGYDAGSSSIKATLLEAETGIVVAGASSPRGEFEINAPQPGWAEQDAELWWENLKMATAAMRTRHGIEFREIKAIGISYQMHGLVVVDKSLKPLRPSIIWCDSRAASIGEHAFSGIGREICLGRLLNSPGNFTASRLKWLSDNETDTYDLIHKVMLPGDYLAMKMTGEVATTPSGLSEMILWDYVEEKAASLVLDYFGIPPDLLPRVTPTFSMQGELSGEAAEELGLREGTPVCYRAGDQPNNAFSLKVLEPGEVAATAGTSGVIYGVSDRPQCDSRSRVNTFLHVNHLTEEPRYGVLLCVNGTGILYQWLRKNMVGSGGSLDYTSMNELAASAPVGSGGLVFLPYGNGAERTLEDRNIGASLHNLDLNNHGRAHILRAAQEGVIFALNYGLEIMRGMGFDVRTIRAGETNMFLSPLFGEIFANVTGATVELYDTDGSQGAARGAGLGAGIYKNMEEAFVGLRKVGAIEPDPELEETYTGAYQRWYKVLKTLMETEGSNREVGYGGETFTS